MLRTYQTGGGNNPLGFIGPLLILTFFFALLFFIARGIFTLLYWVGPVLLIIALILDYKVVTDFLQFVWDLLFKKPLLGLLVIGLGIIGWPILTGYLFFKALGRRSMKKLYETVEKEQNTFTEFEEVVEDESFLELPQLNNQKEAPTQDQNKYDQLF